MSNLLRVVAVLGCVVALAASASPPSQQHVVVPAVQLTTDYDSVWAAVIDVFADHNWPTQNLDKSSGIVSTDWMQMSDPQIQAYADCGGSGIAREVSTQVRFNVRAKEIDSGATVTVNSAFRQIRSFDGRVGMTDCNSRGTWERELQVAIERRAKTQKPKKTAQPVVAPIPSASARGFYCTKSPSNDAIGTCTREKTDCEATRGALITAASDMEACTLTETAWCFGQQCGPTEKVCTAQKAAASSGAACAEAN